jgi:hypothetical protein
MSPDHEPAGAPAKRARRGILPIVILSVPLLILALLVSASAAPQGHGHGASAAPGAPPVPGPFRATTEKTFPELMEEAMAVMDRDMMAAPQNGSPDHDFVTMMIPHHQGAVDMAKVLLLYGKDPELRTLAQQIITDQQYEINLMRVWLSRHGGEKPPGPQKAQP